MIKFNNESREKLSSGVQQLTDAVKVTLGPSGRNVVINYPPRLPQITKDGVTVARSVNSSDDFEDTGIQIVRNVAQKTCNDVGDGTTTSIILANAIFQAGLRQMNDGINVTNLKHGIDYAVKSVIEYILSHSTPVDNDVDAIRHIAEISSNRDSELSDIFANIFSEIGKDGVLTIEDSKNSNTYYETIEGIKIEDRGYYNQYFINNAKGECVLENTHVFIVDHAIKTTKEILPILDRVVKLGDSLLIICDDIDPTPLSDITKNVMHGILKACVIKSPSIGEYRRHLLKDIAALTGAEIGSIEKLGFCDKVVANRNETLIVGGHGDPALIQERVATIREFFEASTDDYTRERIQKRLASLQNGVAILYIGAQSEFELNEKKDRADDAIKAVQASIKDGVIAGGGSTYLRSIQHLRSLDVNPDDIDGVEIVCRALFEPFYQILSNAGVDKDDVINISNSIINSKKENFGYNVTTRSVCDLFESGVIDPTKVVCSALLNAASVAGLLLTTECVIIKEDKIPIVDNGY